MAGTKLNLNGLDYDGNVANFIETELVISTLTNLYSFIQVRGSPPLFWEYKGSKSKIKVYYNGNSTKDAFLKHFHALQEDYKEVMVFSLLSHSKPQEDFLKQCIEKMASNCKELDSIRFI